jgi:hypothetical protein
MAETETETGKVGAKEMPKGTNEPSTRAFRSSRICGNAEVMKGLPTFGCIVCVI